jgi:outer membrane protein insertion porin family/translocation and assembly module TamA
VTGNDALSDSEIEEHIASRATPRFFGVFKGLIYDYEVFDRYVLERDLQRIERYYRARGYYWTHVRAGRVRASGKQEVQVEIVIDEGEPVHVTRVDVHTPPDVPAELRRAAERGVERVISVGDVFQEAEFDAAAEGLGRAFADHGYAWATVRKSADVDVTRNKASLGFWVDAGPIAHLGQITIKGRGTIPEDQIRRTLNLEPGELYSLEELESAERALLDLGVFSAASVRARVPEDPKAPKPSSVPIDVELQVSRFRSVHLGGGVQIDSQRTDVHLVAGWEDRNFLGGLRSFLVEFVPGAVIYPTRLPDLEPPERLLPEARLRLEFRQPSFLEARTSGVVRTQASLYPVLLSSERDPAAPVLGYRDLRAAAGLERSLYWKLWGSLTHNVQVNDPFAYVGTLDPFLDTAIVSYPELFLRLDLRDDRLEPKRGVYIANTLQVAGVGGDARDIKVQPEVNAYVPLPRSMTLALRGTVGFLFAQNYGDTVVPNALTGSSGTDQATWVRDVQLMFLRGFFGGGAGSNRGYGLREIGPHGYVPFYNPGQTAEGSDVPTSCEAMAGVELSPNCDLPLGGFSLYEASVELRFPLFGPLRGAVFADAADVSPYEFDFRLDHPHLSAGVGLRYSTPIGPVRFDVGYRIPGLQAPDTADEFVPDELFGLPIAISFGIGEPF